MRALADWAWLFDRSEVSGTGDDRSAPPDAGRHFPIRGPRESWGVLSPLITTAGTEMVVRIAVLSLRSFMPSTVLIRVS